MSTLATVIGDIQDRADNLQYISEQTHEVNVFVIGRNQTYLDADSFEEANPFVPGRTIEAVNYDSFILARENADASGGWTALRSYIEADLQNPSVFKVGITQRDVYVVGLFDGHIVGVRTFAIET